MNNKITLQELAAVLATNMDVTKKTAEAYIRHMFDIVQEYALLDGQVKIKGFGTFKVVGVDSRESVNVNTGERVLIEGHSKLTFTPDAVLRDQVNKPFADFTTVILNPATSLEEMEAIEADEDVQEENLVEEPVPESAEEVFVEEQSEETPNEEAVSDTEEVTERSTSIPEETPEEEEETQEETESPIIMQEEQTAVNHIEHQTVEQMTVGSQYVTNQTIQQMVASAVHQELTSRREVLVPKRMLVWMSVLVVMLLCATFCGGYYMGSRGVTFASFVPSQESQVVSQQPKAKTVNTEFVKSKGKPTKTVKQQPKVKEEKPQAPAAKPEVTETKSQDKAPKLSPSEIRKRAAEYEQVPDGEYLIIGTKGVHVMSRGDNMYKIAKKHYGNSELASYIIFYNKFRNPDKVFLGAKVRLPELVKKE